MNLINIIKGRFHGYLANRDRRNLLSSELVNTVDPSQFQSSLHNPSDYYRRAFQDFHRTLPPEVRAHRAYFGLDRRGFGEDAFHTMWWQLIRKFKPESFLEIGVYRGQVISLVALLAKLENLKCEITGISPFSFVGDSVSTYRKDLDYRLDTLSHFSHFGLAEPTLIEAFSTDPNALAVIASQDWDMIYIDGNHDYEIVLKDWESCSRAIKIGGIIILDDSGLTSTYHPPAFSTGGHPGPSKLASEIDRSRFEEILQVGHNRVFRRLV